MTSPFPGLETKSSGLTIFLSLFCPGLGHLYLGKVGKGVAILVGTLILYSLTWFTSDVAKKGQESHQALLNFATSQAQERGQPFQEAFNKEWKELEPARRENAWWGFAGLMFGAASFAWWLCAMVSARKLCERLNRETFDRAKSVASGA
jgi:hypothetical protein